MSTIEKALGLLGYFSEDTPEIGLSDFKTLTKYDKGTTHRYLSALRECGFLEQNPSTKAYRLGPAIIRLAAVREKTVPLRDSAKGVVLELAQELEELVHTSLPQAKGMSLLFKADGGHGGTRVGLDESDILPFHATSSGIAMLAFGDPEFRRKTLASARPQFTKETSVSEEALEGMIAEAQLNGFASVHKTYEDEVSSVAMPFFDQTGHAIGTIAVATPSSRMTPEMKSRIIGLLSQASMTLSANIGGLIPQSFRNALIAA